MNRPQLMGILNLTPDSFSGAGAMTVDDAIAQFDQLVEAGAQIVDLGAESTRPGAVALTAEQEWARLGPVLQALALHPARDTVRLSVDTYHASTAAQAMALGIDIVNDVTGLRADAMLQTLSRGTQDVVVMHALTVPADPEITWAAPVDAVTEILAWKKAVIQRAMMVDIDPARLIFDPGIGFGKTPEQSLALVLRADELVASGGCWLVGHSRKSFLKLFSPAQGTARDDLTLLCSAMLAQAGVQVLRVHDVARHRVLMDGICM